MTIDASVSHSAMSDSLRPHWLYPAVSEPCKYIYIHICTYIYTHMHMYMYMHMAQLWRICLQCRRRRKYGFNPCVGKIPWRRKWQSNPVLLPGKAHGQRSHQDTVYGVPKSQTQLSKHTRIYIHTCTYAVEHCSAKKNETLLFAASSWTWMDLEGIVPREYDCPECLNSYLQRQIRGLLFDIFLFLAPKLSECMASCFPKSASSNPKITPDFPPNHLNILVHVPEKASHLIDKERLLQIPHLIS